VADAVEAARQHVQEEAADELVGRDLRAEVLALSPEDEARAHRLGTDDEVQRVYAEEGLEPEDVDKPGAADWVVKRRRCCSAIPELRLPLLEEH
jgi:hypothetical protein